MPWSGGTYSRTNGTYSGSTVWQSDAAAAVKIRADRHDTHDQDLATGINNCLTKDGQNSPSSNISWGNFKITSLANGAAASDAANYGQTITALAWSGNTITATRSAGNLTITVNAANITSSLGFTPVNKAGDSMTGSLSNTATIISGTSSGELRVGGQSAAQIGRAFKFDGTMAVTTSGVAGTFRTIALTDVETFTGNGNPAAPSGYALTVSGSFGGGYRLIDGSSHLGIWSASSAMTFGLGTSSSITRYMDLSAGGLRLGNGFRISTVTLSSAAPGALASGEVYFRY